MTNNVRVTLLRGSLAALVGVATLVASLVIQGEQLGTEAAGAMVDDISSTIAWNGSWVKQAQPSAIGGFEHAVEGVGASAMLRFSGSQIKVHYRQAPNRAIAHVSIDGVRQPDLDQFGVAVGRRAKVYPVAPGPHTIVVTNSGGHNAKSTGWWIGIDAFEVNSAAPAPVATATPTKTPAANTATHTKVLPTNTPTQTKVPATAASTTTRVPATNTATATSAPSNTPTRTPLPPTRTATTAAPAPTNTPVGGQAVPVRGAECPAWVHDRYTTTGPDGTTYPTWHPKTDPEFGCWFAHEHGDDPRTSRADSSMPAFGYIGLLVGDNEPHVGFKVFVQNAGAVNNDGRTIAHDSRMVFHMGTGGSKRFSTRFHSLEYDFVARDGSGHEVHVMGMADTGGVGSICSNPRQGKTVMLLPGLCETDSPYEIWETKLDVGGKATVITSFAVFDVITIMDPANPAATLLMGDYYPQSPYGYGQGCKREAYSGPVYYYNANGPTTFRTDAYGEPDPNGPLVQFVSRHNDLGVKMTTDGTQTQAKLASEHCVANLKAPN